MVSQAARPNHRLGRLMSSAGFSSHKAFARAVRWVSAESGQPVGCDHTSVSRWLHGTAPRADTAVFITTVLSRALGRDVSLAEAGLSGAAVIPLDLGLRLASDPDVAIKTFSGLLQADAEDAPAVTGGSYKPGPAKSVALEWLVERRDPARFIPSHAAAEPKVGVSDVTRVQATLPLFADLDGRFGGGHARRALIAFLQDEVERMLRGRCTDAVGSQLLGTAAEACLLAAWMSYDSGRHGLAQRYFVQALSLADAAGDRLLGANVLDAMSHQATFLGRYSEAASLARGAQAGAGSAATASLAAHFAAMEARALAGLGDVHGCHRALAESAGLFERRNPESDPSWFQYFDEAELDAEFAHCLRDLGQYAQSARHAERVAVSGCGPRSDFFVTMVQADAYLGAGQAEQACATVLAAALPLAGPLRSARCVDYLRAFRDRLAASAPAVLIRELDEQASQFEAWQMASPGETGRF